MNLINSLNFGGYIISFILGYIICKKKNEILTFVRSLKFFLKSYKNKDLIYNEFFEDSFEKSDYVEESEKRV